MKFEELLQRMRALDEKLDEQYGEILTEDEDETDILDDSLEGWTDYLAQKHIEAKSEADRCKDLAKKYTARAKSFEARADYHKKGLFVLVDMAQKTIKTAVATVYKSRAKETLSYDENSIPDKYMVEKVVKSVDQESITKELKSGKELEFARMLPGKEFVVVKI